MSTVSLIEFKMFYLFLGAFIYFIGNLLISSKHYRDEYYKKIIDKRISSLEKIENFLLNFNPIETGGVKDNIDQPCYPMLKSESNFEKFRSDLIDIQKNVFWLDKDIVFKLNSLGVYLTDNSIPAKVMLSNTKQIKTTDYEFFDNYFKTIQKLINKSWLRLYKVKKYIKFKHHIM